MNVNWLVGGAIIGCLGFVIGCGSPASGGDDPNICGAGRTYCSGSCVSTRDDAAHCGSCGQVCGMGQTCVAGTCACLTDLTACGTSCVDRQTDGANCGQCGLTCATPLVCSLGECTETCGEGLDQCGSSCTDLSTDVRNCGECGKDCPSGACVGGQCSPSSTSVKLCDEPEPWPTPAATQIVGGGTEASCTEEALRQAVSAGGLVRFECGTEPVTVSIASAIEVKQETVVDGEGKITLDGGGTSQIFVVTNKLSVRNLRFVHGNAPSDQSGGAVSGGWRSNVEVIGCTFEDNTAGKAGGAVAVGTGSSLTIVSSQFRRNQSGYGGAVYSLWSPLHVANSEFTDNSTFVNSGGGAIGTDGALDPEYRNPQNEIDTVGGTIEICGSHFQNNRAYGAGGAAFIWVYPPDKVLIERSTIEGNTLGKDSDGTGLSMGGGMRVSNGEIAIKASSFLSNSSETHGGALYLDCEPTCTITNSTFYSNRVSDGFGGAIFGDKLRVNNVTFAKNFANGHGGVLFGGSDWVIKNSVFADNEAGNPWGQAYSCSTTGTGDRVIQWVTEFNGAGSDPCVPNVIAADPMLGEPADNGGPTFTMLPEAGSPAIQVGSDCEAVDQRGYPRDPNACDLGSVELP